MPATDRDQRVVAAASSLAVAYMRFLAEGDSTRASLVLGEFQNFARSHLSEYAELRLTPSGMFDRATGRAMVFLLFNPPLPAEPATASAVPTFYATHVAPRVAPGSVAEQAYLAARDAPLSHAGREAAAWALSYAENVAIDDESFADLLEDLSAQESHGPSDVVLPETEIIGIVPKRGTAIWPWAVAGGLLVLAGVGLAARKWGKRGRR